MSYLIGTDEAGYGPNLGPLIISASVWSVPEGVGGDDLYDLVGPCVATSPGRRGKLRDASAPVAIGDSKVLYKPKSGLRHLERGLLAALALLDCRPATWREVWDVLSTEVGGGLPALPWYVDYDSPIPLDANRSEIEPAALVLSQGFAAAHVQLLGLVSRPVFPEQFNRLVEHHGSKGAALSHTTLELAASLVEPLERGPISIVCDKHGGRNRYQHLVAEHFPEGLIEVRGEGRERSVYRFGPDERRVEIRFQMKADSHLPAALASMASKYLRELAMRALNEFWRRSVDGLRPTAGYPQDAKRFKAEIAAVQAELGIEDRLLWRVK
ncbi:MAG: hypothetical protein HQ582_29790 [Planctomycetes bacterium]|nr:hypothetical protein [Planctomycetota bacterium]